MGEVIVITSGKGGVGKTTTTANLGSALASNGKKVALVDTDIGLRNLDVVMGLENRIVFDLVDVIEEKCKLKQALIKHRKFNDLYFSKTKNFDNVVYTGIFSDPDGLTLANYIDKNKSKITLSEALENTNFISYQVSWCTKLIYYQFIDYNFNYIPKNSGNKTLIISVMNK